MLLLHSEVVFGSQYVHVHCPQNEGKYLETTSTCVQASGRMCEWDEAGAEFESLLGH